MNIGSKEIKDLLEQYRRRKCSEADLDRFYDLINDHHYESRIKEVLQFDLDNYEPNESEKRVVEFSGMYRNIQASIQPLRQIHIDLQNYSGHQSNKRTIQATAILIFVYIGGRMSSYFIFKSSTTPSLVNSYNEIKAPLGARSEILLPDGSRVWLNAGSIIKYLDSFNKENCNILLEGEAYVDVTVFFYSEEIIHFRFTGTLQDETLTQVLDLIKLSAPIDYRLEGKNVYISENKELKEKFSDHLKKK